MKRVKGTKGVTLLECINLYKNKWAVRFDVKPTINEEGQNEGVNYLEEIIDYRPSIEDVRTLITKGIDLYDMSSEVSNFVIGGFNMWLDKGTRTGLALTITTLKSNIEQLIRAEATGKTENEILAEIATKIETTTTRLWSYSTPPEPFDLPISKLQMMLGVLETYAKATFDKTQEHKRALYEITSIDELLVYNFRDGYPNVITF